MEGSDRTPLAFPASLLTLVRCVQTDKAVRHHARACARRVLRSRCGWTPSSNSTWNLKL